MERAGDIQDLCLHPVFRFEINGEFIRYPPDKLGRKGHALKYIADFQYSEGGQTIVEDSKGHRTEVYKIKQALMLAFHGIEIRET